MGDKFIDKFSLLHFATGIIFYFFNISLRNSIIAHILFEIMGANRWYVKHGSAALSLRGSR